MQGMRAMFAAAFSVSLAVGPAMGSTPAELKLPLPSRPRVALQ